MKGQLYISVLLLFTFTHVANKMHSKYILLFFLSFESVIYAHKCMKNISYFFLVGYRKKVWTFYQILFDRFYFVIIYSLFSSIFILSFLLKCFLLNQPTFSGSWNMTWFFFFFYLWSVLVKNQLQIRFWVISCLFFLVSWTSFYAGEGNFCTLNIFLFFFICLLWLFSWSL